MQSPLSDGTLLEQVQSDVFMNSAQMPNSHTIVSSRWLNMSKALRWKTRSTAFFFHYHARHILPMALRHNLGYAYVCTHFFQFRVLFQTPVRPEGQCFHSIGQKVGAECIGAWQKSTSGHYRPWGPLGGFWGQQRKKEGVKLHSASQRDECGTRMNYSHSHIQVSLQRNWLGLTGRETGNRVHAVRVNKREEAECEFL